MPRPARRGRTKAPRPCSDRVKSADHREHWSAADSTHGKRLTNVPGHFRFARELAVGGDACDELRRIHRRPGALEQMLPEFLMVTAAELGGEQPQMRAALQMALVQEGHCFRVLWWSIELAPRSVVEVDEMRGYGKFGRGAQRHQFGRVIAERIVRGMAPCGCLAVGTPPYWKIDAKDVALYPIQLYMGDP